MTKPIQLPEIKPEERTPLVQSLVEIIERLAETVQRHTDTIGQLKDEISVLKGEKKRPVFKPSKMEDQAGKTAGDDKAEGKKKRPGSKKRSKTQTLQIHEERVIAPEAIPEEARFKGYQDYVVQELMIAPHNIRYRLERWQAPNGELLRGQLPDSVDGHFGRHLKSYILYQHHHAQVTQPLLLEQLREWGIDISSGQIDALLSQGQDAFFAEKEGILRAGLESAAAITVDDTGARHQGKNGYATHIGNAAFAWFESTGEKSRINFLQLLRAGQTDYWLNETAWSYMQALKLPQAELARLQQHPLRHFPDAESWQAHLANLPITAPRHVRIATEAALLGSVLHHGCPKTLAIVSDGAGQFDVPLLLHGLCWVHAERTIHKLNPLSAAHREAIESIRGPLWTLYADLKHYQQEPTEAKKAELSARFDELFTRKTPFATLNHTLQRLYRNKAALLLALERPDVPLHTNGSERDIRDYVKKRKVSGGTRSDLGRRCRDTFASLKKTCRKQGISFWHYLIDRLSRLNRIPPLPLLIRQQAMGQ